jgi:carbohydrate kinase (thermoresistant glucokinase family)
VIVLVMGIAGSGKSTAAAAIAAALGFTLIEGDDFHPPGNVRKMTQSIPLTDADRWPWLHALRQAMDQVRARGGSAVVACSALKESYRRILLGEDVQLVYLKVSEPVAGARLAARKGHFFAPALLQSQLDALEEPQGALTVDADQDVGTIITRLVTWLRPLVSGPDTAAQN